MSYDSLKYLVYGLDALTIVRLGLRDLRMFNEALIKKLSFINEDSFLFKFLRDRFLKDHFSPIQLWHSSVGFVLCSHLHSLSSESIWVIGNHSKVLFWKDNWLGTPLIDLVQDVVSSTPNYLVWHKSISGVVACVEVYESLCVDHVKQRWGKQFWAHFSPPSRVVLFWCLLFCRLPTEDALVRHGFVLPSCCRLCYNAPETLSHLFLNCRFAQSIWRAVSSAFFS